MKQGASVLPVIASIVLAGAACAGEKSGTTELRAPQNTAGAVLEPRSGTSVSGRATFTANQDGVTLALEVRGAAAGVHAVHIHETGDCSAPDAASAGAHWNPSGVDHGRWGTPPHHLGDIGNLQVGEDGVGELTLTTPLWSIGGPSGSDIVGKAVIVHAAPDDFKTQPTGAAGGRIACGVIRLPG
jgi:Cu-Zn family superoxide dismutase